MSPVAETSNIEDSVAVPIVGPIVLLTPADEDDDDVSRFYVFLVGVNCSFLSDACDTFTFCWSSTG